MNHRQERLTLICTASSFSSFSSLFSTSSAAAVKIAEINQCQNYWTETLTQPKPSESKIDRFLKSSWFEINSDSWHIVTKIIGTQYVTQIQTCTSNFKYANFKLNNRAHLHLTTTARNVWLCWRSIRNTNNQVYLNCTKNSHWRHETNWNKWHDTYSSHVQQLCGKKGCPNMSGHHHKTHTSQTHTHTYSLTCGNQYVGEICWYNTFIVWQTCKTHNH
jgi:hypothetical protein